MFKDILEIFTYLAAIIGGIIGLRTYFHSVRVHTVETLFKMENEFKDILPFVVSIEDPKSYHKKIRPILEGLDSNRELAPQEHETIASLDRFLRYLYLCSLLISDAKVTKKILLKQTITIFF